MMYHVLNSRGKKRIAAAAGVAAIVFLVLWAVSCYRVNKRAFHQKSEVSETGEWVELDGNFVITGDEQTEGYSIRVDGARLMGYEELVRQYGETVYDEDDEMMIPKYVCLLDVTVKNEGNADGGMQTMGFILTKGALQIPVDYEIWDMTDENYTGDTMLRIRPDSEVSLTLPFVPQGLDEALAPEKLYKILEDGGEAMLFSVSDFPVRKMIKVYLQ